jgi:hypothetical protein
MVVINRILISLLLISYLSANAQDTTLVILPGNHFLFFNFPDLAIRTISVSYFRKTPENNIFEYTIGYKNPSFTLGPKLSLVPSIIDPPWLYRELYSRFSYKMQTPSGFYFSPSVIYKFKYYNNVFFKNIENSKDDTNITSYYLSRRAHVFGVMAIWDRFEIKKKWIGDLYFGIGLRFKFETTSINKQLKNGIEVLPSYGSGLEKNSFLFYPSFHLGYRLGFCFVKYRKFKPVIN